jgi:hypothetical protein
MFLLDPDVAYLNHGSFGACPRPVFDVYQEWQRVLEREPIDLLERGLMDELARVRGTLGEYVGAPAGDLALLPNATSALNTVLRSLPLRLGDEILTTGHEYGRSSSCSSSSRARGAGRRPRRQTAVPRRRPGTGANEPEPGRPGALPRRLRQPGPGKRQSRRPAVRP